LFAVDFFAAFATLGFGSESGFAGCLTAMATAFDDALMALFFAAVFFAVDGTASDFVILVFFFMMLLLQKKPAASVPRHFYASPASPWQQACNGSAFFA
jgi:hypothetical protein